VPVTELHRLNSIEQLLDEQRPFQGVIRVTYETRVDSVKQLHFDTIDLGTGAAGAHCRRRQVDLAR
jgi:hypothetical protein